MIQLQAQLRNAFGKQLEALRAEGLVPAEIYGHGKENVHVSVPEKEMARVLKEAGESTVIEVSVEGAKHPVLIQEVQKDPLKDTILHIDFYEVRMDEKVRAEVPIVFTGEAPAVKAFGGILVKSLDEIEVEALPADLPAHIAISLAGLTELNQTIYAKDIDPIEKVKFIIDPETAVASVTEQRQEEEETTPPAGEVPTEAEAAAAAAPAEEEGK
jgi:large subunit ribosomal protein L25